MIQAQGRQLLTTRSRIVAAMALTPVFFTLDIRALLSVHSKSPWLISPSFLLQGWLLIAVNVFFYCYACWFFFWLIRRTAGRERFSARAGRLAFSFGQLGYCGRSYRWQPGTSGRWEWQQHCSRHLLFSLILQSRPVTAARLTPHSDSPQVHYCRHKCFAFPALICQT